MASAAAIKLTDAQFTALETAGVFEQPLDDDDAFLQSAIVGRRIQTGERVARLICNLSNDCDDLSDDLSGEAASWARKDSRVLAGLYSKLLRASV